MWRASKATPYHLVMVQRGEPIEVSPAVLVWTRRSIGLEPGEAADVAGVSPDDLDAWESGVSAPGLGDLTVLARAYHRPLATLLLSEPPERDEAVVDFRSHRGYRPPRMSPGLHRGIRHARRQQRIASELAAALRIDCLRVPASVADLPEPAVMAARERDALGISIEAQAGWAHDYAALAAWRRAVEDRVVVVLQLTLPRDEVRGFSIAGPGVPAIALAAADPPAARVFTLLHELGHLLIGGGGLCAPEAILRSTAGAEAVERFCNRFAGHVAVPSDALARHPAAQRLAAMSAVPDNRDFGPLRAAFRVSNQVLWYRLHEVGMVTGRRYDELWHVWSRAATAATDGGGAGRPRARRSLDVNGARFVGMVLEAEERGEITYADALDYLSIRARDWNELAALVGGIA